MKTCALIIALALPAIGCSKKDDARKQAPAATPAPAASPAAAAEANQPEAEPATAIDFEEGADQQVQEDNLENIVEKLEAEVPE